MDEETEPRKSEVTSPMAPTEEVVEPGFPHRPSF